MAARRRQPAALVRAAGPAILLCDPSAYHLGAETTAATSVSSSWIAAADDLLVLPERRESRGESAHSSPLCNGVQHPEFSARQFRRRLRGRAAPVPAEDRRHAGAYFRAPRSGAVPDVARCRPMG